MVKKCRIEGEIIKNKEKLYSRNRCEQRVLRYKEDILWDAYIKGIIENNLKHVSNSKEQRNDIET